MFTLLVGLIGVGIALSLFYRSSQDHSQIHALNMKLDDTESRLSDSLELNQTLQQTLSALKADYQTSAKDFVTGLIGWHLFERRLEQSIFECERMSKGMSVLTLDIDHFKSVNQALGYEAGNQVLSEVAERLLTCVRQVDEITRSNKDTFVSLLSFLAKPETTVIVVQRMLKSFEQPFQVNGQSVYLTACIGVAVYPADGTDAKTLLHNSDVALGEAKKKGRNQYHYYQKNLHETSQRELMLNAALHANGFLEALTLSFHAITEIGKSDVYAMEAEAVWHPSEGEIKIHSNELIRYAEEQRKAGMLCEWVLAHACKQFMMWQSFGFTPQHLMVQVPISQLENGQFVHRLSQTLQTMNFDPSRLILGVRIENDRHPSYELLEKSLNMINYLGIQLAITDFGCRAFALQYLYLMNLRYIKLDSSWLAYLEKDIQAKAFFHSVIEMLHALNIVVIANGVETTTQLKGLESVGVSLAEGHLMGDVMTEEEVMTQCVKRKSAATEDISSR